MIKQIINFTGQDSTISRQIPEPCLAFYLDRL